jgi:hypothetical protein
VQRVYRSSASITMIRSRVTWASAVGPGLARQQQPCEKIL